MAGRGPVVVLDGTSLTCRQVAAAARDLVRVEVSRSGLERAMAAAEVAAEVTARRAVYGRTTGVGGNRGQPVSPGDAEGHGLRLLRSHASGGGPPGDPECGLAMLVVRANQIAAGGSGVSPGVLPVLAECVNRGLSVPIPAYGAIGTGDLTALALTALCLRGERDWVPAVPDPPRFALAPADVLGFMSSNAATLGEAALACHDLGLLLRAALPVAALAHLAVDASDEPYAAQVQDARPHPGQRVVAAVLRGLLAGHDGPAGHDGRVGHDGTIGPAGLAGEAGEAGQAGQADGAGQGGPASRVQDPYGYRALPQVHGPAVDAAGHADRTVTRELNSAAENPLIDVAGRTVWHNGNFHSAYVGLALDAVRAALFQTAALSAARLGTLVEPAFTGLEPFLATDPPPSSGIMILEYVAHSAIADIRRLATPAALGSAVLSRGAEEHAGFATQSARATTDVIGAYRIVLACELVAAVRALRLRGLRPPGEPLAEAFGLSAAALPAETADRPLDSDLTAAQDLLPQLAAFGDIGA